MMNRRKLLTHAGAVSLAGIAATLASVKDVQAADYKALVVVFLSGGYDGNNVLVPLDGAYSDYAKARPSLALPKDSFVRLPGTHIGHTFGLSAANRAFADLFTQKTMPLNYRLFSARMQSKSNGYKVGWVTKTPVAGVGEPWMPWLPI